MELDWERIAHDLDERGAAVVSGLLDPAQTRALVDGYPDDATFRKRIVMQNHGYGRGEYKYSPIRSADGRACGRRRIHRSLASRIAERVDGYRGALPDEHASFIERRHDAGQLRPTPPILKYGASDFNCLHQDLYGEHVFFADDGLLAPPDDFDGGSSCDRTASAHAVAGRAYPSRLGDAVIFAVNDARYAERADHRVKMRHGVSRIHRGQRYALGIPFHDAT